MSTKNIKKYKLLKNIVTQFEKNVLNTSQYIRREIIPTAIPDNVLKKKVCDALSLTGILVKQGGSSRMSQDEGAEESHP